jgi:methionyl-tRNA synthetase
LPTRPFRTASRGKKRSGDPADQKDGPAAAEALIGNLCYVVRDLAILIHPFMPEASEQIASFFGLTFGTGTDFVYKKAQGKLSWDDLGKSEGLEQVVKCEVLFSKLEDDKIAELRERFAGSQKDRAEEVSAQAPVPAPAAQNAPAAEVPAEPADIRFAKTLDLRVAKIVKIERHPKADKLYIETLELVDAEGNTEQRVIVSGLVPHYKEEELLGKNILLAYNLKPAKLRGTESRGMLLAASDRNGPPGEDGNPTERVEALDAADIPLGTRVTLEGLAAAQPPAEIDIETFFSIPIEVKDNVVMVGGRALLAEGKPVKTKVIPQGVVR